LNSAQFSDDHQPADFEKRLNRSRRGFEQESMVVSVADSIADIFFRADWEN
jgi:hypothetical protein